LADELHGSLAFSGDIRGMDQFTPALFRTALAREDDGDLVAEHAATSPAQVARTEIRLSVHTDIAAIEGDWRDFQARADGTVFQTYEWLSTWQRHIGARRDTRPAIVIGRDARGEIMLLFPLAVERTRLARQLTWLGSELCDYNAPLLVPEFALHVSLARFEQLWADVLARLRRHPGLGFDLVHLDQMPAVVGSQPNPLLHLGATHHPNHAYVVSLGDSWETLYSKRSASTRRHDRAKRKKLAQHGELVCVHASGTAEIAGTLETLIDQKTRWFAEVGVSNMFARPGCREFFFDIATNPETRHITHVSRLDAGRETLAANLGLTFGDRFYYVLTSYDRDSELAKFGPGGALLHDLLRHAIDRGLRKFDLSVGNERYKREWCDTELDLYDHTAIATVRGACAALPLMTARRVKLWIKSKPAVWNAFRKARALAASIFRD
jgi:CelD/BcsL family acetyltransferase involved in cellulose biosynthesis